MLPRTQFARSLSPSLAIGFLTECDCIDQAKLANLLGALNFESAFFMGLVQELDYLGIRQRNFEPGAKASDLEG